MPAYRLNENAGELSERITVSRYTRVEDSMGGGMDTWAGFATLWACVEPVSGRERDMANQTESPRDYRFIVRRTSDSAGILAKDKITWRNREFNVRFIAVPDFRSQFLRIDAEEGVAV